MRPKRSGAAGCRAWSAVAILATAATACGARTGLALPDTASDAGLDARGDVVAPVDRLDVRGDRAGDVVDVADVPPLPDVCVTQQATLSPRPADVLFVIDRSSSMGWDLRGGGGTPSRWTLMRNAFGATLPRFQSATRMGAMVFPSSAGMCVVGSTVDVPPAPDNAAAVLRLMDARPPSGLTPTFGGIEAATRFYATRPADGRGRAIVLATDGAPNCNADLPPATCSCTSGGRPNPPCTGPTLCLDDTRTVSEIATAVSQGVPVYVIGIDEDGRADLVDVLNRMAVAGGRPNTVPGAPQYYSVRRAEDLVVALDTIQRLISACVFRVPARPSEPDRVVLTVDSVEVRRDPGRVDGWDWTGDDMSEISLFGPSCDQLIGRIATVVARVPCRPEP